MRNILVFVLAAVICLATLGCGGGDNTQIQGEDPPTTEPVKKGRSRLPPKQ